MRQDFAQRQRGAALLAMLAVIMLGSSWYLVSQLNAESGARVAVNRVRNAEVLNRAKQALIGYVAAQAANSGEDNPGRLPCPEHPWYIGNNSKEGIMGPSVGVSNPGVGAPDSNCTMIGRLPWRSIGIDKLVDASGEPLWYVVSPAVWALQSSSTLLTINSNTLGQLRVDGQPNAAVALIIAPGRAMDVQASAGCAVRTQVRSAPSPGINALDYLECYDPGTPPSFTTTGPSNSFNDQVVRVTVADIMPAIEAAIAHRIEREIVPALNTVYTPAGWGFSGSKPLYPYAVPFINTLTNPGPNNIVGPPIIPPSNYRGTVGTYQGLLPFFQTQGCNPETDPRCNTTLLAFSKSGSDTQTAGSGSIWTQSTCAWVASVYVCTGEYLQPTISVTVSVRVTNVAMGLRAFDLSKVNFTAKNDAEGGIGTQTIPFTATTTLNSDGSATITVAGGALPDIVSSGWEPYANYVVSIDRAAFGDHALLSSTDPNPCPSYGCTGWFVRNEWYRLLYYATAQKHTAVQLPSALGCSAGTDCLTVTTNTAPANNRSAILILAGRSINGNARPSATLADYFEFGNRTGNYEKQTVTGSVSNVYADTGTANAYAIAASVTAGRPFQFKAANANTGASTLTATATGVRSLLNADGSNLTASQIQANAVTEVTYDGTQFTVYKRPFNDRVVVIGSN